MYAARSTVKVKLCCSDLILQRRPETVLVLMNPQHTSCAFAMHAFSLQKG